MEVLFGELDVRGGGGSHVVVVLVRSVDRDGGRDHDDVRTVHGEARGLLVELDVVQDGVESGEGRRVLGVANRDYT